MTGFPDAVARDGSLVNLLFASSGIEHEIAADATRLELLPGVELPVASIGHLLALKLLARDPHRRPQDQVDVRSLLDAADPSEIDRARAAIALITERGYARNRDLATDLDRELS